MVLPALATNVVEAADVAERGATAADLDVAMPTAPQTTASTTPEDLKSRANKYITQERFNRTFTLPATEAHGDLTVKYAVGGLDSEDAPTLLFIGGLFGGRFLATIADYLGTKLGMRIVVTDRPGFGGSSPVKPSLRLPVWLETVPVLMRTINARHISICAHSCGVIYALNTIYFMPQILPPSNRKLYLFSPWVPPNHSGITFLSISSYLPSSVINAFDSLARFVNSTVMPTVQFSGMVSGVVSAPFYTSNANSATVQKHKRDDLCRQYCGVSAAERTAQDKALMRRVFRENIRGSSDEVLLLLQKEVAGSWGPLDSYETYPGALEVKMRDYFHSLQTEGAEEEERPAPDRFVLKTFWAETDQLIGKKGEKFFDKCFQRFTRSGGQSSDGEQNSCLSYESEVVSDTDHDTLFLPQYGALSRVLEDILEGKNRI